MTQQHAGSTSARRSRLRQQLGGVSTLALVVGLWLSHTPVRAQSFQATGDVVTGFAQINTSANFTEVQISDPEIVINWTPTDVNGTGTIDFQPQDTTTLFTDGSGFSSPNFTVLNRIIPVDGTNTPVNRIIAFNGTVNSGIGGTTQGNIWFYSPGGILVGANAQFNVGSLVLTTADIDRDGGLYGQGNTIRFRGAPDVAAAVSIASGAQLNALSTDSAYIALVAPRVVQGGELRADGPIALVGAEEADISINAGLFGITITQGTTDTTGIEHTGTTGGPPAQNPIDPRRITMVAVPKNDALTMLLSGTIGYSPADFIVTDEGGVVLSAGQNLGYSSTPLTGDAGNIQIGNARFTSRVVGGASGSIDVTPGAGEITQFDKNAELRGNEGINLIAAAGSQILANGSGDFDGLFVYSDDLEAGGDITVRAEAASGSDPAGLISVIGGLNVDVGPNTSSDGEATGGTITMLADGGTISASSVYLDASAFGGTSDGNFGLDGRGGSVDISVANGGTIAAPAFYATALGAGGGGSNGDGGGFGGSVTLTDNDGVFDFAGVVLDASAYGPSASAGAVSVLIQNQSQSWDTLSLFATASSNQAIATIDNVADLTVTGGQTLSITDSAYLYADAASDQGVDGSSASAGTARVTVDAGSTLNVGNGLYVSADALLSAESYASDAATSPDLTGGLASVTVDGGSIQAGALRVTANATGLGATVDSGVITGGTAVFTSTNGGAVTVGQLSEGTFLTVSASAEGGTGPSPGHAQGGSATVEALGGSIFVNGNLNVSTVAEQWALSNFVPGGGFDATGGTSVLRTGPGASGASSIEATAINVTSEGRANLIFTTPTAGNGTGGSSEIQMGEGTIDTTDLLVSARGFGGTSNNGTAGGAGEGGSAVITASGGTLTVSNNLAVNASGIGGNPALGGTAGEGRGGTAGLDATGGTVTVTNLIDVLAQGLSTDVAVSNVGNGGDTFGGDARLTTTAGGSIEGGATSVLAEGIASNGGGEGTRGGIATGGDARLAAQGGSITLGQTTVSGNARFGTGQMATTAVSEAGSSQVEANEGGIIDITGNLTVDARAERGAFVFPTYLGAPATGGSASLVASNGGTVTVSGALRADARGVGGDATVSDESGGNAVGGTVAVTLGGGGIEAQGGATFIADAVGGDAPGTAHDGSAISGFVGLNDGLPSSTGTLTVVGDFNVSARGLVAAADGRGINLSLDGGVIDVTGASTLRSNGSIGLSLTNGTSFDTTLALMIQSDTTVTAAGLIASSGDASIIAPDGITISHLDSGGTTLLQATNGAVQVSTDLRSTGLVTVTARDVDLTSLGALSFADADATDGDLSIATTGDLAVSTADAAQIVSLTSQGGAISNTGAVNGEAINIFAGTSVNSTGALTATNSVNISAPTVFQLDSLITAQAITIGSSDIEIGVNGQIGVRGTTGTVALTNTASTQVSYLGGLADATGYSLDAVEFGKIAADESIAFATSSDTPAEVVVRDLGLTFGPTQNIGTGGTFSITTQGLVRVEGEVALTTASQFDAFDIDATRIEVASDVGRIAMQAADTTRQGRLTLTADEIFVAAASVIPAVDAATTTPQITALLDQPGTTPGGLPAIVTGSVIANANDGLYIQNAGATTEYPDRRAFEVNSFAINTADATTIISINGVTFDAANNPVTGLDTIPTITINGSAAAAGGQFDPLSTINGCVIGQDCTPTPTPTPTPPIPAINQVVLREPEIAEKVEPPRTAVNFYLSIEAEENQPDALLPLVDEPVTGVGNDDLWEDDCRPNDSAGCMTGGQGQ